MTKELIKEMYLEASVHLEEAIQIEEDNDYSDAMESMDRTYWEGQTDALYRVYRTLYGEDVI